MTVLSLSMVVLAALIHATWNLLAKRAAHAGTAFVGASTVVACVFACSVIAIVPLAAPSIVTVPAPLTFSLPPDR